MNMIVGASGLTTAAALSSIAEAASPDQESVAAMLHRAEHVVETLSTRHVCDGWVIDRAAAEQALDYMRRSAVDPELSDGSGFEAMVRFFSSHGQSLDWIMLGDPTTMICGTAAHSPHASPTNEAIDPVFAAIEAHKKAEAALENLLKKKSRAEDAQRVATGVFKSLEEFDQQEKELLTAERDAAWTLASTTPSSLAGVAAVYAYIREAYDGGNVILGDELDVVMLNTTLEQAACKMAGLAAPPGSQYLEKRLREDEAGA